MKTCRTRFVIGQVVKVIRVLSIPGPFATHEHTVDELIRQAKGTYGLLRRVEFDILGAHFHVELAFPDRELRTVTAVIRRAAAGQQPTTYSPPTVSTATGNGLVPHPGP